MLQPDAQPGRDGGSLPRAPRTNSREKVRTAVLFAFTAALASLSFALTIPFFPAITWSLALAIVAHPLHAWVERRMPGRPDVAAAMATAIVAVGILTPSIFVIQQTVREATAGLVTLQAAAESGELQELLNRDERSRAIFQWIDERVDFEKEIGSLNEMVRASAGRWIEGTVKTTVQLVVAVFLLFFLFRDRVRALQELRAYLPLSRKESDLVLQRIQSMIHATIFGTLAVAALQGILGGLMFWILGLPGPLLWGSVMAFFGIVPLIGTFVVWLPAVGFLASQGSWGKAMVLLIWGGLVVSLIDNILYPMLVGREIRMHTALVFLAIAGGLSMFGVSGLVLGPVILVTCLALIEVMSRRTTQTAAQSGT